jgi:hypothetical protein
MYQPSVFKLINSTIESLSDKNTLIQCTNINLPLISLGSHYYLNRTKSAMSITKTLQISNEFYYVINPFENKILNYEESLDILADKYLNINNQNIKINSSSFYKLWEIFFLFDLINDKELTCAVISNNTEGIIQSIINFKQKLGLINSQDKIFNLQITQDDKIIENNKNLLGIYNKQYPKLIKSYKHPNYTNISDIKTILMYKKEFNKLKTLANLIIGNGKIKSKDIIYQEQESYILILGEIIAALKTQNKDGNFILRISDTFTMPSIKLIYIVISFYKDSYIYKPFLSRPTDSEKFLICKNFLYDNDDTVLNKQIFSLETILTNVNSNKYIYDIYPELIIPKDFLNQFKFINIKFANPQQVMINEIIKYIKENNYFGDKYHLYKNRQIIATKWWLNTFFPPSNNLYENNKNDLQKLLKLIVEKHEAEMNNFTTQLI